LETIESVFLYGGCCNNISDGA